VTGSAPLRVAVVTTHPIQYQVPWFQRLSALAGIDLHVYFAMLPPPREQGAGFGLAFAWDVPLLDGYAYSVLENRAREPSLTTFSGCDTPRIRDEIRRGRYDAVIVNGWVAKSCVQALLACRMTRTPCLVRGEVNGLPPRAWWKHALHRVLFAQYAAFLAIGRRNRDYYLEHGVDPARIFETPYCVDNERFAGAAAHWRDAGPGAVRERFGLDPAATVLLFCGKFIDKKRPLDVVEAVRVARAAGAEVQALMVGAGPLEPELRARARDLPVRFAGFLNQSVVAAAYAAADCLVLPSDHGETWGLVVNEAMACGLPAIVSDQVGCAADLITPGGTGYSYACGDVRSLAALVGRCASDRDALAAMGRDARARVFADYHYGRVTDGIHHALRAVTTAST
jgi:glycosyltransferase involved in cell wall biosynthesis